MSVPQDWIEHRRGDRELVGWMRPEGDGFVVIDLLGREVSESVDWATAEELLESTGIGFLAEPFELQLGESWIRVRLVEVSTDGIRVKYEDWGATDADFVEHSLPFPVPSTLRPRRGR